MIRIEVDCNNDEITINNGHILVLNKKVKNPSDIITVLDELLNAMGGNIHDELGVELLKIDEENRKSIGEW